MIALMVVLGAAVGAPLRYLTDLVLRRRLGDAFPWGTFVVNVVGSFVLGVVLGAGSSPVVAALLGTGFCGALTTYSTFGYETVQLISRGRRWTALVNAMGSVLAGLAAAGLGLAAGAAAAWS
ncbi:fluoride efflux transporter CrcB [Pseudonocardia sp. TRM90224]|uniref:fluoride efflux transporter CrcB n=1 Tax=Pseudonocardia sp. TRM90224 TaxID=2812678 RepID=UPI001E38BAE1|nr:fluoride efflux transporter CrcB [Pseudonocardia sp. TRM90224]